METIKKNTKNSESKLAEAVTPNTGNPNQQSDTLKVMLTETLLPDEDLIVFWDKIKEIKKDFFTKYVTLIEDIFDCESITKSKHPKYIRSDRPNLESEKFLAKNKIPFTSGHAYSLLKYVTEKYVHITLGSYDELGNWADEALPKSEYDDRSYLKSIIDKKLGEFEELECTEYIKYPTMIELIWSYFIEEGMQVQTMIAISRRFQNIRSSQRDPLSNLTIDPLRPLNNILWGYVQDTQHRLTIARRTYEYDAHYGLKLIGKAVPNINSVESRSKFIGAFNNLLIQCGDLFKQVDDLTINPDGFPVLNAIREVHLVLADGSNNQFGDLPTTARIEMLIEQFILARPEIKEFLHGKAMMPYKEGWMDRVDAMKRLQGWTNTSISYFYNLADYGEKILLSIRWGNWSEVDDSTVATQWAVYWRDAIQRYIHSYRIVTGVDLSSSSTSIRSDINVMPSILIKKQISNENHPNGS